MTEVRNAPKGLYSPLEIVEMVSAMKLSLGREISREEALEALEAMDEFRVRNGLE